MKRLGADLENFLLRRQHKLEEEKYLESRRKVRERKAQRYRVRPRLPSVPLRLLSGRDRKHAPRKMRADPIPQIKVPESFSFLRTPKQSISVIRALARRRGAHLRGVVFDHSAVKEFDLAAECTLDIVAIDLRRENRGRKLILRGHLPEDDRARRFIRAVGIIKNLSVAQHYLPEEEERRLKIFKMRTRRNTTASPLYKAQVLKEFVDYIDECLVEHGFKLRPEERARLLIYAGEILDNAEEHAGMREWSIVGYVDTDSEDHLCEIAIFNFGRSFAETFSSLSQNSYAYKEVAPYLDQHRRKGFFNTGWREEDLLTLVALQGHVSSKNTSSSTTRGQGTVDIIKFFQKVHLECVGTAGPCAEMAILSGKTHILFDGTYQMAPDASGRNVIAFNAQNDLSSKPDPKYVRNLGGDGFPGTVISIRFPMKLTKQTEMVHGDTN